MATVYVDRLPPGWFVLDVMRAQRGHTRDWVALLDDRDPDAPQPLQQDRKSAWLRIPGKHRDRDAACDRLEAMVGNSTHCLRISRFEPRAGV
jgi:hypothetical protein